MKEIPLFPLRTVLFPGGSLRLRIFEPRYLDMVSRCMREDIGFGIVLIRTGSEVGAAECCNTGTLARIADWYRLEGGLLGITAQGVERLHVRAARQQRDGLMLGEVELLGPESSAPLEARHAAASAALVTLIELAGERYVPVPARYEDAAWVGGRLAELLPVPDAQKQGWLEIDDPVARLDAILPVLALLRRRKK